MDQITIGVIGAGAASTALLFELLSRVGSPAVRVVVVESDAGRGAGTVYADDLECALVNRQARYMSVLNDDADDFVRWARANWRSATDGAGVYYPRSFFRRYLQQRFREVCARWPEEAGTPIDIVAARVRAVGQEAGRVALMTTQGRLDVDFAILCTGHGLPRPEGYERDTGMLTPYPLRNLVGRIDGHRRVAIRGAGLTAIDSVLAILESCPDTTIELVSRSGMLPDTRADLAEDLPLTLPPRRGSRGAALTELRRRFRAELAAYGVSEDQLRRYVDRVQSGADPIRENIPHGEADAVIQSLSVSIANRDLPLHWFGFSRRDRESFHRHHFRQLQAVTAPIPQGTARRLRAAFAEGRLASKRGNLSRTGRSWSVVDGRGSYDLVVDGTGTATNAGQSAFEAHLVRSGTALSADFGGIEVTANCQVARPDGRPTRLYAIGYTTRGSFLYSSSLYQSALQARAVARDLAARLGGLGEGRYGGDSASLLEVLS